MAAPARPEPPPAPVSGRVPVAGADIAWERWPRPGAPPVVLVHGTSAHSGWWHAVAPSLGRYDLVAVDLSGHGESGRRERYSMAGWAEEVLAVVLAVSGGRALVVGHSIGGLVAAGAAARAPDAVAGLVLADSIVVPPSRPAEVAVRPRPVRVFASVGEAVARFRLEPPQPVGDRAVFEDIARGSLRRVPGGWSWKVDPAIWDVVATPEGLTDALPGVRCPVVVVRGEHSALVGPDAALTLARLWGRPVPQHTVAGAHHHLMVDDPGAFGSAVRAALADLAGLGHTAAPTALDRPDHGQATVDIDH